MQIKKDIEIAQEAVLEPIVTIAERLGMQEDDLELYGRYKAKLSEEYMHRIEDRPDGRLILVTAINPTPAGEGKTTTSVGLSQAFGKLGKNALLTLREHPSYCQVRRQYSEALCHSYPDIFSRRLVWYRYAVHSPVGYGYLKVQLTDYWQK